MISDNHKILNLPCLSIRRPVTGANIAIIKAGRVNTNLTRNSAFSRSANAIDICGKAGEIVITDITVRLLTRRSVSFNVHVLFSVDFTFIHRGIP
jgi:hypothetical protein